MNWIRCPRCHTLNDIDRSKQCDGCNGNLDAAPPAPIPRLGRPSAAQEEGARDLTASQRWTLLLLVLATLGFGTLLSWREHRFQVETMDAVLTLLMLAVLTFLVTAGLLFRVFSKHVRRDPSLSVPGFVLASVLAIAGAGLLIFLTCSLAR